MIAVPWWASTAQAAGGGGAAGSLGAPLLLLLLISAAYLLTHFVVERAQQRFLFVSGVEYVVLGALLGPHVVPSFAPLADVTSLAPIVAFGAGWVGLLYGLGLRLRVEPGAARGLWIGGLDASLTFAAVCGGARLLFASGWLGEPLPPAQAWPVAVFLGAAASAGSSSAVDLLASRYGELRSTLLPLLRVANHTSAVLAVVAFGVGFCLFHQGATRTELPIGPLEWGLLTIGLGGVLGLLFYSFVGDAPGENTVLLAMVGILLFASGAAFFLNLSPVLVNLLLGFFLAQTGQGERIRAEVLRTSKPAGLVLLLFAGSQWRPPELGTAVVVVLGFVGVRLAAKVVAAWLATIGTPWRASLFRGLLAQGDVAIAMALSFRLVYEGPAVELAYTAVLFGVVLDELVSPRLLRALLVDAGELREDVAPSARPSTLTGATSVDAS